MPRVRNADKNPAYPAALEALKAEGAIPRRVALRQGKYLNLQDRTPTRRPIIPPDFNSVIARCETALHRVQSPSVCRNSS